MKLLVNLNNLCEWVVWEKHYKFYIPLHPLPLLASWYPLPQLHTKEPTLLVQVCAHPPLLVLHSLMSGEKTHKHDWHLIHTSRIVWLCSTYMELVRVHIICTCCVGGTICSITKVHGHTYLHNYTHYNYSIMHKNWSLLNAQLQSKRLT